jgi:hypothetical protein
MKPVTIFAPVFLFYEDQGFGLGQYFLEGMFADIDALRRRAPS